jgi:undecaprenyl-diphosphatase
VSWNVRLLTTINGWSGNTSLDAIMRFCAKDLIFVVFGGLLLLGLPYLRRRQLRPVFLVSAALVVAFGVSRLEAALYPEGRPFQTHRLRLLIHHAAGQSFPSDHATAAFAVAFAVIAFLSRRWGLALLVAAALIGFARVYAGLHYPVDILGGALAAVIGVAVAAGITALSPASPSPHSGRGAGAAGRTAL